MSAFRPSGIRQLNDIPMRMRDGVHLSGDIYLPNDEAGPWPVILARTPYDNTVLQEAGTYWAQQGYVYVAQDVRGRHDSEGDFVPWENETADGYDTLEWIAPALFFKSSCLCQQVDAYGHNLKRGHGRADRHGQLRCDVVNF